MSHLLNIGFGVIWMISENSEDHVDHIVSAKDLL